MTSNNSAEEKKEHYSVISLIVENEPGVLARIAILFSRKGYNIETVTVGKIPGENLSSMIFTLKADTKTLEQIIKQTEKLIHTIYVNIHSDEESIVRGHMLARVKTNGDKDSIEKLVNDYKARIIHIGENHIIIELVNSPDKIDEFVEKISKYELKELRRSGINAVTKEGY